MTGLQIRNRTLGELLTELRARLGFVTQGPAAQGNAAVLTSFLQEGHDYIYDELKPPPARKKTTIRLQPGSYLYDWHNDDDDDDIDPGYIKSIWLVVSGTQRMRLEQGISEADRSFPQRQFPTRYDTLNGQMELYPIPDQEYDLIVEYIASKPRFAQEKDRPGVADRLILLYAIANAKAHYRHPDAQAAGQTFINMLRNTKSNQRENRRYIVGQADCEPNTVVSTPDGYRFRVK